MKILSCNAGYLQGDRGSIGGYVPSPLQAVFGDATVERRATERLSELIARERPDVTCLVEVDDGSIRTTTDGQLDRLLEALESRGLQYSGRIDRKYGSQGLVATLPFFKHLGNGVLFDGDHRTDVHYLDTGPKRLVTEVRLTPDVALFVVHLSLGSRSRRRQLAELGALIERSTAERTIVTGDFNTFGGHDELDRLIDRTGLNLYVPGETVSNRPFDELVLSTRALDLVLCSPSIGIERCDVLDVQVSDHRPVVTEIAL